MASPHLKSLEKTRETHRMISRIMRTWGQKMLGLDLSRHTGHIDHYWIHNEEALETDVVIVIVIITLTYSVLTVTQALC